MPDYTKLLTLKIWGDAALQSFYSLCCCWGALTTLASYNRFHTNCYKQSWMLCFSDVISAIFFGVVVFATMGALAYETNAPKISALVQKGK
uniref:CASP-like protein n=1 Tax=Romanomermis culicivorax TaxID=13658 RepID=A0A915KLG1_ROMCU